MARLVKNKPLWSQIEQQLVNAINNGTYPVGTLLPPEVALCELYGVSRHTIRAALGAITRQGLIRRAPHLGTVVIATSNSPRFEMYLPSLGDIDTLASKYARTLLSIEKTKTTEKTSEILGFPIGTSLLRLDYVRRLPNDNRILSYCRTWLLNVNPSLEEILRSNTDTPLVLLLEQHTHLICYTIHQRFRACTLHEGLCKELGISPHQPVLEVTREFLDQQHSPIAVAKNYYLDSDDEYTMHVNRKGNHEGNSL